MALSIENLKRIADQFHDCLELSICEFDIGGHPFHFNSRAHLMGVINLSPDSWYRESVCLSTEQAVRHGQRLVIEGADLVDLGAESSLAHAARVDETLQIKKLIPIIHGLSQAGILVSVETYYPSVAEACLDAGASVLNLTGTIHTKDIFRLVADRQSTVIICYIEGDDVRSVADFSLKQDMISRMEIYFLRKIEECVQAGVKRIILDPGLGFYYRNLQDSSIRVQYQMKTFLHTFRLRKLGYPICHALPHAFEYFEDEVRCAEPFFAILALLGKTSLLRTHEVKKVQAVSRTLHLWQSP